MTEPAGETEPGEQDANGDAVAESIWTAGEYDRVARQYLPMAAHLVERLEITDGETVLDIGCGTGSAAITAARRGGRVTGIDLTPEFLEQARESASIADCESIEWHHGDATALPFTSNQFDVTLSNLGHMYADPPEAAAAELARVTTAGGRIGFTAWTPTSLYPAMASTLLPYLDPTDLPEFSSPPFMWGDETVAKDRLRESVTDFAVETGTIQYPSLSPGHFWKTTRETSGVFKTLVETVPAAETADLRADMCEQIDTAFDDQRNIVELDYLLVTGIARSTAGP